MFITLKKHRFIIAVTRPQTTTTTSQKSQNDDINFSIFFFISTYNQIFICFRFKKTKKPKRKHKKKKERISRMIVMWNVMECFLKQCNQFVVNLHTYIYFLNAFNAILIPDDLSWIVIKTTKSAWWWTKYSAIWH